MSRRGHGSLALLAIASGIGLAAPVSDAERFADAQARRAQALRDLAEDRRRAAAARAWVKRPTVLPASATCAAGKACVDLACAVHGAKLRKLGRRAAQAAGTDAAPRAPREVTMPAGSLPGVLGDAVLRIGS